MAYTVQTWSDRNVERPLTFTQATNTDGSVTLTPAEGNIVDAGTPLTADRMNHMESGIENNDLTITNNAGNISTLLAQAVYTGAKGNFSGTVIEIFSAILFTNGTSATASADVAFDVAFAAAPTIVPADITQVASYADDIIYPFIYNQTTTGFSVRIQTASGNFLGTAGTPANIFMKFLVIGVR